MTVDFVSKYEIINGFMTRIQRFDHDPIGKINPQTYHLCGYVTLEPGHPLFGVSGFPYQPSLRVHGGITYSREETERRKHWVLGFDCNHLGDWNYPKSPEYVRDQLVKLTEQLRDVQAMRVLREKLDLEALTLELERALDDYHEESK